LVVAVSSDTTNGLGQSSITDISSANLAKLLDGTYSEASQVGGTGSDPIYVFIREPLSGTYNTMEYTVANTTVNQTSQDVGLGLTLNPNQPVNQRNCTVTSPWPVPSGTTSTVLNNPLVFTTGSGGGRYRAIGTGNELKVAEYYANASGLTNNLAYGFWSVANYNGYTAANLGSLTAKYLKVDGVDPLISSSSHSASNKGVIPTPTTNNANMPYVDLGHVADGTYPIWSLLRLATTTTSATSAANTLASAVQEFVTFGQTTSRPDFVPLADMTVVRSHFAPPGVTFPPSDTPNNGNLNGNGCGTEAGGDVGGVVLTIPSCTTGERR
jgi:hypothetical protein